MNPNTNPPSGTRDFLASDIRKRREVIKVIQEVYESFGFEPLETPAFENLSTLLGKYGEEGDQLLFRILLRGEKLQEAVATQNANRDVPAERLYADLALKYDLTVPLARVMARYAGQLPKFYKRYQIQPVWRADRPAKGRFREFVQCDVDVCGSTALTVETEVIAAVCTVLERLQFKDFSVALNHREVLRGLIEAASIAAEMEGTALVAVDKWDKIGKDGVATELVNRGIAATAATKLLDLLEGASTITDSATRLRMLGENLKRPSALKGLDDLQTILQLSAATGTSQRLALSPNLARGLSYYTGAIFEVVAPGVSGSLGGGGRYDGLVGMFAGREIPACGFSLGLERILLLLEERGYFAESGNSLDILFTNFGDTLVDTLALATRTRRLGFSCEVYSESAGLKPQFNYAAARNARFVAFLGEREKESGLLRIKDQTTGTEASVAIGELETALPAIVAKK